MAAIHLSCKQRQNLMLTVSIDSCGNGDVAASRPDESTACSLCTHVVADIL